MTNRRPPPPARRNHPLARHPPGRALGKKEAAPTPTVAVAVAKPPKQQQHHHHQHKKHPSLAGAATPGVDPQVAYRQAVRRTLLAVGAAVAFGVGLYVVEGKTPAMEFFAGYLIEESLSVDNIFVFIMLFEYFKVRFLLVCLRATMDSSINHRRQPPQTKPRTHLWHLPPPTHPPTQPPTTTQPTRSPPSTSPGR
jgi:hypothetical protein